MNKKTAFFFSALSLCALLFPSYIHANNLSVSNVRMGLRDPAVKTLSVLFDLKWDNSWRNKINHDAVWLTVRLNDTQAAVTDRRLCQMKVAGLNPSGTSKGNVADLEVYVPQDKLGAFVRRSVNGERGSVESKDVMLTVDYSTCGFTESSQIGVMVNGLEMVFIPEGSFYAGDFGVSAAAFRRGSADDEPWDITNEAAINVTATTSGGYYYTSAGQPTELATGSAFNVPASFPKGYTAFYTTKYEITEGQWVDFVNSLPSVAARARHDLTDNGHKGSDAVVERNTISCSGSPLVCMTERPFRPVSFLSWKDLTAFLDWSGLRPMTELEFEKTARGPFVPIKGEYAWSSTDLVPVTTISGMTEDGEEQVADQGANARFNGVALTGGDAGSGVDYQNGPVRSGIFATSSSDRTVSGAGNFGALELSGNVKEWVVTVGNADGLGFTGMHGDGYLTTVSGFEGQANVEGWPGMDVDVGRGITGVVGVGFRGGSWADTAQRLRVSDRQEAASAVVDAAGTYGGRGVRTYDGE